MKHSDWSSQIFSGWEKFLLGCIRKCQSSRLLKFMLHLVIYEIVINDYEMSREMLIHATKRIAKQIRRNSTSRDINTNLLRSHSFIHCWTRKATKRVKDKAIITINNEKQNQSVNREERNFSPLSLARNYERRV